MCCCGEAMEEAVYIPSLLDHWAESLFHLCSVRDEVAEEGYQVSKGGTYIK